MGRTIRATRAARLKARAAWDALRDSANDAEPIAARPPERPEVARSLNRIAIALGAAQEELSKLRHELGVCERLEPKRRRIE